MKMTRQLVVTIVYVALLIPRPAGAAARRDDLVISFGTEGVWTVINGAFSQLHPTSVEHLAITDLDGNGVDDIALDFGDNGGIWLYWNNILWDEVHSPSGHTPLAFGDIDRNGIRELIFVADATAIVSTRVQEPPGGGALILGRNDVLDLVTGQLDGVPADDLILNFPSDGIWVYRNGTSWFQLHPQRAQAIAVGDFDRDGRDEVAIGFADGFGTWIYRDGRAWLPLHPRSAAHIAFGDFDRTGTTDFVLDFGPGLGIWIYDNLTSWRLLHPRSARNLVTADLDANGVKDIVVDFGPGLGIWVFQNNTNWYQLTALSANQIAVAHLR
jgi:hypothetical protein